jgi:uncharacterized protein (DUF362 family)
MNKQYFGIAQSRLANYQNSSSYSDGKSITKLIRNAIVQAGLGINVPDNPLNEVIGIGMTVLLKPNWVLDHNEGPGGMDCMVTHPEFILAVVKEVAAAKPAKIIIGDAPIQGCKFDKLASPDFIQKINIVASGIPVKFIDFRRTVMAQDNLSGGVQTGLRPLEHYVEFDLGVDSLLESISRPPGRFRVTMYDPARLALKHQPGKHQYLLSKEAFEADVIINLPKLKTHRKAGITGALKNLVGLNGNKDFLPHHRVGGTAWGGDCYPGTAPVKSIAEYCLDRANKNINTPAYKTWIFRYQQAMSLQKRFGNMQIEGSWYGNDTIWRTVLDLNRILLYGSISGRMEDTPQRQIWTITDGIVAGEGEGPLHPAPKYLGVVTVSNSSPIADAVHASLMHFDPYKIPVIREAFQPFRWPLVAEGINLETILIRYGNSDYALRDIAKNLGVVCIPPVEWKHHIEVGE